MRGKADQHHRDALPTLAKRAFGREQLKPWRGAASPQAERDFKFTRQATNKIGGISEEAGRLLLGKF